MRAVAYFDGGARPTNPGHAGIGVVIGLGRDSHVLSRYIGWRSNNFAEYTGLVVAIKYARHLGATELEVFSDSKLVVEQVHSRWRMKSDELRPLNDEAVKLLNKQFPGAWDLGWVPREDNAIADDLCTQAIHAGMYRNPWVRRHAKRLTPGKIVDPFSR